MILHKFGHKCFNIAVSSHKINGSCFQIDILICSPTAISWTHLIIENHADICSAVNPFSLPNVQLLVKEKIYVEASSKLPTEVLFNVTDLCILDIGG